MVGLVTAVTASVPPAADAVDPLGKGWERGAIIPVGGSTQYAQPASDESIAALRRTGSTHLGLYSNWYMEGLDSSKVFPDEQGTPTDHSLLHAMKQARSRGMSVSLTPVVRPPEWQGNIVPRHTRRWFRSYRDMVAHYAKLAERGDAGTLVVGAELLTMTDRTRHWKRLIELARECFQGELTYSANHIDEAAQIDFWKRLDKIGISAYMPLVRDEPNPSVNELFHAWKRRYVDRIRQLQRLNDRPIVFTEVGYSSRKWTAARPWAVPPGEISQAAQRRPYEALYRVWSRYDWFDGVYWWYWPAGPYDPSNGTPSPRGKAAEQTMRDWNKARHR